jgi:D-beta-D-heptose 7-phosphate kinase/D-beta-D-heptose 1-phosphate adenosyltransferase
VPVLRHSHQTSVAGGAANVAANLTGLGLRATVCGFWGNDAEHTELSKLLSAANIDHAGMVLCDRPTISKTRIVARRQQMLRWDIEQTGNHSPDDCDALSARALELAATADAIVLSDYAKGTLTRDLCQRLIAVARQRKIPVLVDPKDRDFTKYSGATTICPNLAELSQATGVPVANMAELLDAAQHLVATCELDFLTVTLSERGITVLTQDTQFHSPAQAREVFDVSGAGDTVIAVLAAALSARLDIETAVALANVAAGIVVGKLGTAPIERNELIAALTPSSRVASTEKVLSRERLLVRAAEWRATGQKLVFTNGCFDLLHVGHITLLEQCRQFGDKLILGINTDASVQRLKGPTRPLIAQDQRAELAAALAAVDAVTFFDEDTPRDLIAAVLPDILIKGADWAHFIAGREEVEAAGGQVLALPLEPGYSTSGILEEVLARAATLK